MTEQALKGDFPKSIGCTGGLLNAAETEESSNPVSSPVPSHQQIFSHLVLLIPYFLIFSFGSIAVTFKPKFSRSFVNFPVLTMATAI